MVVQRRVTPDSPMDAPPGFTCALCGEQVDEFLLCEGCGGCVSHCPFCGRDPSDACPHYVTGEEMEGEMGGLDSEELDELRLPDDLADSHGWTEDQLKHAFGDEYELIRSVYEDSLGDAPSAVALIISLLEVISTPVVSVEAPCWGGGMASDEGEDFYSEDAVTAWAELSEHLDRLKRGFRQLAAMAPGA